MPAGGASVPSTVVQVYSHVLLGGPHGAAEGHIIRYGRQVQSYDLSVLSFYKIRTFLESNDIGLCLSHGLMVHLRMLVLFVRSLAENIAMSFVLIAVMYLPIGKYQYFVISTL